MLKCGEKREWIMHRATIWWFEIIFHWLQYGSCSISPFAMPSLPNSHLPKQNLAGKRSKPNPIQQNLMSSHHGQPVDSTGRPMSSWTGFCWLGFGMFHHPAWAVGSYSSGPPAGELPKFLSTEPRCTTTCRTLYICGHGLTTCYNNYYDKYTNWIVTKPLSVPGMGAGKGMPPHLENLHRSPSVVFPL